MKRDLRGVIVFVILSTIFLTGLGIVDYDFFRIFVELSTIFLALVIYIIAVYSSEYSKGSNLLFIGISCLAVGTIDLMYIFNSGGFTIFDMNKDFSTHLWLAARGIEAIVLFYAYSKLIKRNDLDYKKLIVIFGSATLLIFLIIIFGSYLPVAFDIENGYTVYKKIIDVIIIVLFIFAIYAVKKNESRIFNYRVLILAIVLKIISEVAFLFDTGDVVYLEIIRHLAKYVSYILLFMVFARDLLLRPYENIFRAFIEKEEELTDLSKKDSLTGLYNHSTSYEIMREIIKKNEQENIDVCLMMIDVDDFKCINDKNGHVKGDEILVEISEIFKNCDGPLKLAGRYGGDEFVVLYSHCNGKRAIEIANKIFLKMEELSLKVKLKVTLSIGIAEWKKGFTAKDLVRTADAQMYEAKSVGKNTYSIKLKSE